MKRPQQERTYQTTRFNKCKPNFGDDFIQITEENGLFIAEVHVMYDEYDYAEPVVLAPRKDDYQAWLYASLWYAWNCSYQGGDPLCVFYRKQYRTLLDDAIKCVQNTEYTYDGYLVDGIFMRSFEMLEHSIKKSQHIHDIHECVRKAAYRRIVSLILKGDESPGKVCYYNHKRKVEFLEVLYAITDDDLMPELREVKGACGYSRTMHELTRSLDRAPDVAQ